MEFVLYGKAHLYRQNSPFALSLLLKDVALAFRSLILASSEVSNPRRVFDVHCVTSVWQDWALGVLHAKIIAAITLMGPQWWLKTVIEQVSDTSLHRITVK